MNVHKTRISLAACLLLALLQPESGMAAASAERIETLRLPAEAGIRFVVENLVGNVRLESAPGRELDLEARIRVYGRDSEDAGERLAGVHVEVFDRENTTVIGTRYDFDRGTKFLANRDGRNGSSRSRLRYQGRKVTVTDDPGGRTQEVFVDYTVRVPAGIRLAVRNAAGRIEASGVDASLRLDQSQGPVDVAAGAGPLVADTGSGAVTVEDHTGDVVADTGSGSIRIKSVRGRVRADTGSGPVTIEGVNGNVEADTGSGRVSIRDAFGDRLSVDTGSGSVDMENVAGSVMADTGSGGVRITGLQAGRVLEIDTGSGSVEVSGDLSAIVDMDIDTGSGSVALETSNPPSLRLVIETGRGRARVDLPGLRELRESDDRLSAVVGEGKGRAVIDAGGSVSFTMQ